MESRINYTKVDPEAARPMFGLHEYLNRCGLEHSLLNLVYLRASQINGCAYCIDMHSQDLRAAGESEQRLYLLDAWREAPFYTDRERGPWPGQKRSPLSAKPTFRMRSSRRHAAISRSPSWSI